MGEILPLILRFLKCLFTFLMSPVNVKGFPVTTFRRITMNVQCKHRRFVITRNLLRSEPITWYRIVTFVFAVTGFYLCLIFKSLSADNHHNNVHICFSDINNSKYFIILSFCLYHRRLISFRQDTWCLAMWDLLVRFQYKGIGIL